MTTIACNPMDLPYRVQNLLSGRKHRVFREAADPSVVPFDGSYYLFASMSGGFWVSEDLAAWNFVATPGLPTYDYAPDVREIDGKLVVCASRRNGTCDFYRTSDPMSGDWEVAPGAIPFWDPNLFQDDDGRVYLFEGCDANKPIGGRELDRSTLTPLGKRVPLFGESAKKHGWETAATDWNPDLFTRPVLVRVMFGKRPFIEGAWMTKHAGKYYLQYAAPATEFNSYSDGYYVSDSPLGPFEYGVNSPFSSKPGGYIAAAGHGSTFQDAYGNWWHIASMSVSMNYNFERRLGIFPAGFDEDGLLFCNQEFADYPYPVPTGPVDPWSLTGHWMLLSQGCPVEASSEAAGHPASSAIEENVQTWWSAGSPDAGEWIQLELPARSMVSAIQVNTFEHDPQLPLPAAGEGFKDILGHRVMLPGDVASSFLVESSLDGETWKVLRDGREDGRSHDFVVLDTPEPVRYVRATGGTPALGVPFSVSGLRVFGHGSGVAPPVVQAAAVRTSELSALVAWEQAEGARGYNVRYGIAADKLYSCWQVGSVGELTIRSLNAGLDYWVAVDSFNQNGVTRGSAVLVRA